MHSRLRVKAFREYPLAQLLDVRRESDAVAQRPAALDTAQARAFCAVNFHAIDRCAGGQIRWRHLTRIAERRPRGGHGVVADTARRR